MDQQRPTVKSIRAKLSLTSADSVETDASALEVKLSHPVLRTHKGDVLRKLNPSAGLIESLLRQDLITEEEKSVLESEKYVLGKVKLILQSVGDCDDDGLFKFLHSLRESDAHGNNTQLADVLKRTHSELVNGPLWDVRPPVPCGSR